jgi:predicted DNA binding CopG/RHH family protein
VITPTLLLNPNGMRITSATSIGMGSSPIMNKLPEKIKKKLKEEARSWDASIADERPEMIQEHLEKAESFIATRPPRQPVSLRIDPFDLSMLKRIARRKGIPFTQLMSMWLHERIKEEKKEVNP